MQKQTQLYGFQSRNICPANSIRTSAVVLESPNICITTKSKTSCLTDVTSMR